MCVVCADLIKKLVLSPSRPDHASEIEPGSKATTVAPRKGRTSALQAARINFLSLVLRLTLQAIVICDIEPNSLASATDIHPLLVPLAGTPLLGYTLELLEQGAVEEVTLISSRISQIQQYIGSSRWSEKDSPVRISVVSTPMARSVGDFMREIDRRGLAKDDFVLVRGAVLSSIPLADMVEQHRRQKGLVKDLMLMTMLLMETPSHTAFDPRRYNALKSVAYESLRKVEETRIHVFEHKQFDDGFCRCLLSEPIDVYSEARQLLSIPTDIASKHTGFLVRNDLYGCNIDICTPEVPKTQPRHLLS